MKGSSLFSSSATTASPSATETTKPRRNSGSDLDLFELGEIIQREEQQQQQGGRSSRRSRSSKSPVRRTISDSEGGVGASGGLRRNKTSSKPSGGLFPKFRRTATISGSSRHHHHQESKQPAENQDPPMADDSTATATGATTAEDAPVRRVLSDSTGEVDMKKQNRRRYQRKHQEKLTEGGAGSPPQSPVPKTRGRALPSQSPTRQKRSRSLARKLSSKSLGLQLQPAASRTTSTSSQQSDNNNKLHSSSSLLRSTVMAPVNLVVSGGFMAGHAVVQAGKMTTHATVNASQAVVGVATNAATKGGNLALGGAHAVVDASANVGNSVVSGSKALVGGTAGVVGYGGKTMVKGSVKLTSALVENTKSASRGMIKGIKNASLKGFAASYKPKKSKWEEGIEIINELLQDDCDVYQAMTPEQRTKLEGVKKLLLKRPTAQNKYQHIPKELIQMQTETGVYNFDPSFQTMEDQSVMAAAAVRSSTSSIHAPSEAGSLQYSQLDCHRRQSMRKSSTFILQEFAGVKGGNLLDDSGWSLKREEEEHEAAEAAAAAKSAAQQQQQHQRTTAVGTNNTSPTGSLSVDDDGEQLTDHSDQSVKIRNGLPTSTPLLKCDAKPNRYFIPPEFTYLSSEDQIQLYERLHWNYIDKWDFDIFELNELTKGNAMLFVGWAILGAPYSHQAMAQELGIQCHDNNNNDVGVYRFLEEFHIPPEKLYNFIKVIQTDYNSDNPYHNAIHGADVLQSLHTLIQQSQNEDFMRDCPKLHLFAILLSALVHDVAHFGTTNAFHQKLQTELAVMYNDKSVMENWHVAHAFSRMLDMDLTGPFHRSALSSSATTTAAPFSKFQQSRASDCNLLCNVTAEQFHSIRKLMIDAILHTDMTNHFEMVNTVRGMLLQRKLGGSSNDNNDDDDSDSDPAPSKEENTWQILLFMLHMADISGQAKDETLRDHWTRRCFEEFFAQGDQEASLGLPVSPNCDRFKVVIPESQVGFIKFVVEPAFEVLSQYIPFVHFDVLPIIQDNMVYYLAQQQEVDQAIEIEKEASMRQGQTSR